MKGRIEGRYQVAEQNAQLSCGGSAGLEVMSNDTIKMHTGFMTDLKLNSNPPANHNGVEWFNGVGISGEF